VATQGPSAPTPAPSSENILEDGGSIQGGGGGDFSASAFWYKAGEVKHELIPENWHNTNDLNQEQIKKIIALIDPKMTLVKVTSEALYVRSKDGKSLRVDAVNIPEKKIIILFKPTWERYFATGTEVRHLVLHEFLGLAGIDDEGYKISNKFFTPSKQDISFELKKVKCNAFGEVHIVGEHIKTYSNGSSSPPSEFTGSVRAGDSSEKCQLMLLETDHGREVQKKCETLDDTYDLKVAQSTIALDLSEPVRQAGLRDITQEIQILVDVAMSGGRRVFGYGAAAGRVSFESPRVTSTARLILLDKKTGMKKVLDVMKVEAVQSDNDKKVSLKFVLNNSELYSQLEKYNVDLNLYIKTRDPNFLSVNNFWYYIRAYAQENAPPGQEEMYLKNTIFQGLGNIVPQYVDVSCILDI